VSRVKTEPLYLISNHAIERFLHRWNLLFKCPPPKDPQGYISNAFERSRRITDLDWHQKRRTEKNPGCLFFRFKQFDFVLFGRMIVTIEINEKYGREKRMLNAA